MRIPHSKKSIASIVLSAALIAAVAYLLLSGSPRTGELAALRADFDSARYQECIDRVVMQPLVFLDDRARTGQANLRQLSAAKNYPVVLPDADFVRRRVFYSEIAERLKRNTPRETVMAVFNYVVANVSSATGPGEKAGVGVTPETILLRGYGVCDRGAWVFCTLLEQLRIAAYVIYLREPETDVSHHTIAGAEIDAAIYLFDTYSGTPVINSAGRVATLGDVFEHPTDIDSVTIGGKPQLAKGLDVANCALLLPFEPETIHPISAGLQSALTKTAPPERRAPILYRDYRMALIHAGAVAFPGVPLDGEASRLKNPKTGNLLSLWDYPFRIGYNLRLEDYRREVDTAHHWPAHFREARARQLAGRPDAAAFDAIIASLPAADEGRVAAEYFRATSLVPQPAANDAAAKFLDAHPQSFWRDAILQGLGEALAVDGKFDDARGYLEQITGPRSVRAAAFIEAAKSSRLPAILSADSLAPAPAAAPANSAN